MAKKKISKKNSGVKILDSKSIGYTFLENDLLNLKLPVLVIKMMETITIMLPKALRDK
jgi:hypothetical protein